MAYFFLVIVPSCRVLTYVQTSGGLNRYGVSLQYVDIRPVENALVSLNGRDNYSLPPEPTAQH